MIVDSSPVSVYSSYLALDEILAAQRQQSNGHDELLFIIVHQAHELWFKQLLHEFAHLQRIFAEGDTLGALQTLHRLLTINRVVVSHVDALETMTPMQFNVFRAALDGSGFQSAQFREIEAVFGLRDRRVPGRYPHGSTERNAIAAAMTRPSIMDSFLQYLEVQGYPVPADLLYRDVSRPWEPSEELQEVLLKAYEDDGGPAQICERLLDQIGRASCRERV